MDSGLKQRLVGAVVLVALAVIFLPMLLDGSGARDRLNEEIAIPDQPEAPESRLEREDSRAGDDESGDADGPDAKLATDDFGAGNAESPDAADGDESPEDGSGQAGDGTGAEDGEPAAETADEGPDQAGMEGDAAEQEVERGDTPDDGWVVQVGSFQRETNALVLRDRLREDGFDATAEQFETDSGTLWRVWLGPVAGREEGKALERRIEDHRGSDALLMEHSP